MRDPFEDPPESDYPCSCGRCEWSGPPAVLRYPDEPTWCVEIVWIAVRCRACGTGPWVESTVRSSRPVARKPHTADDGSEIRPGERYLRTVVRGYYPGGGWTTAVRKLRMRTETVRPGASGSSGADVQIADPG